MHNMLRSVRAFKRDEQPFFMERTYGSRDDTPDSGNTSPVNNSDLSQATTRLLQDKLKKQKEEDIRYDAETARIEAEKKKEEEIADDALEGGLFFDDDGY